MIRLFSRFDFHIFGWLYIFSIFYLFFLFLKDFNKFNSLKLIKKKIIDLFLVAVYTVKKEKSSKNVPLFLFLIFLVVFFHNLSSIFPYTFSFTTQLGVVLFFSVGFWTRFIIFSIIFNWKGFVSHKIPEGAPLPLAIFLFLIETVREIIRPLTLTLRLIGNIVVGHVLLMLLWNLAGYFTQTIFLFIIFNAIETIVSLIQAYIYFTLISIYCSEI